MDNEFEVNGCVKLMPPSKPNCSSLFKWSNVLLDYVLQQSSGGALQGAEKSLNLFKEGRHFLEV